MVSDITKHLVYLQLNKLTSEVDIRKDITDINKPFLKTKTLFCLKNPKQIPINIMIIKKIELKNILSGMKKFNRREMNPIKINP